MEFSFDNFIGPYNASAFAGPPQSQDGQLNASPDHSEDRYLDWRFLQELTDSRSPTTTGFTQEGGRSTMKFIIGNQFLDRYCTYMVGWADVYPSKGDGCTFSPDYSGINRTLPMAHPRYPWLYANAVESIQGNTYIRASDLSAQGGIPVPNTGFTAPKLPTYAEYQDYEVSISFTGRTYPVLPNNVMLDNSKTSDNTIKYYWPDTSSTSNYSLFDTDFPEIWPEWERFTFTRVEPRSEYLTAEKNTMYFYDPSGAIGTVNGTVPNIPGNIKLPYPSQSITVQWFNVPYRFVTGEGAYDAEGNPTTTTPLQIGLNTVNQHPFLGKPAGTLLFEGVKVTSVGTRPFPEYVEFPEGSGQYSFRYLRVCDLELNFIYRDPKPAVDYNELLKNTETLVGQSGVLQGNNVLAGHNLLPNARNGQYYAGVLTSKKLDANATNPAEYKPAFRKQCVQFSSFPHQLLFTDPAWSCPSLVGVGRHQ
jgi:hypothetical protein